MRSAGRMAEAVFRRISRNIGAGRSRCRIVWHEARQVECGESDHVHSDLRTRKDGKDAARGRSSRAITQRLLGSPVCSQGERTCRMIARDIFEDLYVLEMTNIHLVRVERALEIVKQHARMVRFN